MLNLRLKIVIAVGMIFGCCASGTYTYIPPNDLTPLFNSIDVDKSKDSGWNLLVSSLSSKFFSINTIDSKSDFINLNFKGDPGHCVDGGTIRTSIKNPANDSIEIYDFPAARYSVRNQSNRRLEDSILHKVR